MELDKLWQWERRKLPCVIRTETGRYTTNTNTNTTKNNTNNNIKKKVILLLMIYVKDLLN